MSAAPTSLATMPSPSTDRSARPARPKAPTLPAELTEADLPEHDLVDEGFYSALAFGGLDLTDRMADDAEFEGCTFTHTRLTGSALRRVLMQEADLKNADLAGVEVRDGSLMRATIRGSRLTGAVWSACVIRDVVFEGCRVDMASFGYSTLKDVVFRDCNLAEADFQEADIRGVRFEGCTLERARFHRTKAAKARFSDCDLTDISGVESLRGVSVKSTDAQGLLLALANAMEIDIKD